MGWHLDLALLVIRFNKHLWWTMQPARSTTCFGTFIFVSPSLLDSEYATIHALVEQTRLAHYRLVWIAGGSSAIRSDCIRQCAQKIRCPVLSIGRALSSSILDQPAPLRPASAEEAFYDMLHTSKSDVLCLDHLEILFDEALMLNAVDLIRNASRRFVLIASWPGTADSSCLTFGPADHPSYSRIPLSELECPVHTLSLS
jgi:hypothetical protein